MIKLWVRLIQAGVKTIEQCPDIIKADVQRILDSEVK